MAVIIGIAIGLAAGAGFAFISALRVRADPDWRARAAHASLLVAEAKREADAPRREAQIEAREESIRLRAEIEQEGGRPAYRDAEARGTRRRQEEDIDGKLTELTRREQGVADREVHTEAAPGRVEARRATGAGGAAADLGHDRQRSEGAHAPSALEELIRHELARRVRQAEEEARAEAKRRARNLVADALQRVAANHASETTVSLIELPPTT